MRRVWRVLPNVLTILSLLLCLASAGLWVRSYWRRDEFDWVQAPGSRAKWVFVQVHDRGRRRCGCGGLGDVVRAYCVVVRGVVLEAGR